MAWLLDTDVCIEIIRGGTNATGRAEKESPADLFVSSMSIAELRYGAIRSSRPEEAHARIEAFLSAPIDVLPFDEEAAEHHAAVRASLAATPIGERDLVIASVALSNDLVMATGNVREFKRVAALRVENWLR